MMTVVATFTALPDKLTTLREILADTAKASRMEPGVLSYDILAEDGAGLELVTIERYRDQPSFDAHLETSHVQVAIKALDGVLATEINLRLLHPAIQ